MTGLPPRPGARKSTQQSSAPSQTPPVNRPAPRPVQSEGLPRPTPQIRQDGPARRPSATKIPTAPPATHHSAIPQTSNVPRLPQRPLAAPAQSASQQRVPLRNPSAAPVARRMPPTASPNLPTAQRPSSPFTSPQSPVQHLAQTPSYLTSGNALSQQQASSSRHGAYSAVPSQGQQPPYPGMNLPSPQYPHQSMRPLPAGQFGPVAPKAKNKGKTVALVSGAVAAAVLFTGGSVFAIQYALPGSDHDQSIIAKDTDHTNNGDTIEQVSLPDGYVEIETPDGEVVGTHRFATYDWMDYDPGYYESPDMGASIVFDVLEKDMVDTTATTDPAAFTALLNTAGAQISEEEGLAGVMSVSGVETNASGGFRALIAYNAGGSSGAIGAATVVNVVNGKVVTATAVLTSESERDDYDQMLISGLEVVA